MNKTQLQTIFSRLFKSDGWVAAWLGGWLAGWLGGWVDGWLALQVR